MYSVPKNKVKIIEYGILYIINEELTMNDSFLFLILSVRLVFAIINYVHKKN